MSSTPVPGADLVVVSNRGPLGFDSDRAGTPMAIRGGGLVVTIGPGATRDGALWVAAAPSGAERETAAALGSDGEVHAEGFRWLPVIVDAGQHRSYYDVVANGTLWYCVHGLWDLPRRPRFDRFWHEAWGSFRAVNAAFADVVAGSTRPGATVLIQDYHLALVGGMLARSRPDLRTSLFVHTPWATPGELTVLPDEVGSELLAGMAAAGAVGFHSPRWAEAFADCCMAVGASPGAPRTFVAPAGTDSEGLRATAGSAACSAALAVLDRAVGDRQLIVRVDRIELSKNILRGFWAFDELLETHPQMRGRVQFGAFLYPSRQGLADYLAYGQEVRTIVEMLNAKWGSDSWIPILLDASDDYPAAVAALRRYDVLLVNPVRDGLNLVAHEGPLINEHDGTLVLSRQAGSWDTLGTHALGVNPFDLSETAAALATALHRARAVRAEVAQRLRSAAAAATPLQWWDAQISAAATPPPVGRDAGP